MNSESTNLCKRHLNKNNNNIIDFKNVSSLNFS